MCRPVSIHIHVYVYVYIYMYVCMYIYIYTYTPEIRQKPVHTFKKGLGQAPSSPKAEFEMVVG